VCVFQSTFQLVDGLFFCNVFTLAPYSNFSFYQIDAAKPIPEVFEDVKAIFAPYSSKVIRFHLFFVYSFANVAFPDGSLISCLP
jgi:hypothetical protein